MQQSTANTGSNNGSARSTAGPGGRLPLLDGWRALSILPVLMRPELPMRNYLRACITAKMVGITIVRPVCCFSSALASAPLRYIATISYAVYTLHPYSQLGWLGSGKSVQKYLKRPLCFALSFGVAYLSTCHFERPIYDYARRLAGWRLARRPMDIAFGRQIGAAPPLHSPAAGDGGQS